MTLTSINIHNQPAREVKPRAYICECGQPAVWRAYDAQTGVSKNVCATCKAAK
jgi:hypothetical protein